MSDGGFTDTGFAALGGGGSGGGSSFAHLTEDADGVVVSQGDWVDFPLGAKLFQNGDLTLNSAFNHAQTLSIWDTSGDGNEPVFAVNGDGSLHWGDGTAAPDTHVRRGNNGLYLVDDNGSGVFFGDPDVTGPVVQVKPRQADFWADYADSSPRLRIDSADGSMHWADGTAAPNVSLLRNDNWQLAVADSQDVGFVISETGEPGPGSIVMYGPDAQIQLIGAVGGISLSVDADNDLTVNGVKVALQA